MKKPARTNFTRLHSKEGMDMILQERGIASCRQEDDLVKQTSTSTSNQDINFKFSQIVDSDIT